MDYYRPFRSGLVVLAATATSLFAVACASKPAPTLLTANDAASPTASISSWEPPATAYDESFGLDEPPPPAPPMKDSMKMDHGGMQHSGMNMPMEQQSMPREGETSHGGHR